MVYTIGPISGAHLNPAVTVGLYTAGRVGPLDAIAYIIAQVAGAIVAAGAVLLIARGQPGGYDPSISGLAANGFGTHSPMGFHVAACMLAEVLLTFGFVLVVLGATSRLANTPLAGVAIGLALTLVHLIGIPITNTSVNPARSTGPALFVGGWATGQLWLFWLAPILGAILAGLIARMIQIDQPAVAPTEEQHARLEEPVQAHR
jgi:aquaporin Z